MTFAINLLVLVYHGITTRVRLIRDICDPLFLFVLGYGSPPGSLFRGSLQDGLHEQTYAQPWIVQEQPTGEMIVAHKEDIGPADLERPNPSSLRARLSWLAMGLNLGNED